VTGLSMQDLEVGSIVRLLSGSPKMTVTGFTPVQVGGRRAAPIHVQLLMWSDRLGFVNAKIEPRFLVFPRGSREAEAAEDTAEVS
jgi:hypothetical protein